MPNSMILPKEPVILAGNTHPELADEICSKLDTKRQEVTLYHHGNRETMIQLESSVRFKDCFILQTATHTNVNDAIMELLLMGYTCKTSAAKRLIGVIPYLPYGKQARQRKRSCIAARLLAKMIARSGFQHIITVDLQYREIQGFFDIPVENLRASPFLISYIHQTMSQNNLDRKDIVIVAEHTSAVRKATAYSTRLKCDLAIVHGTDLAETDEVDGRSSPPPIKSIEFFPGGDTLPILTDRNAFHTPLKVIGDVKNRIAILVENIIDDVQQPINIAKFLKEEENAKQVYLVATHALFSPDDAKLFNESEIDEIVVTNTVPHDLQSLNCSKIKTIDISILLTEAIRRMHNNESLSYLFADVSVQD